MAACPSYYEGEKHEYRKHIVAGWRAWTVLYGMTVMSDSIEKAAGAKMRGFLAFFTKNRFIGMLFGMLFCAIVQSFQRHYGYGSQLCKRRPYEPGSGGWNYYGSQCRYYHYVPACGL